MYFSCSTITAKVAFLLTLRIMTLAEVEKLYLNELIPLYETDEAKSILYYAVEHICGFSRVDLMLNKKLALSRRKRASIQLVCDGVKPGSPVQYISRQTE